MFDLSSSRKQSIINQVCEKIRPHLTIEFQSGRLGVSDFRELLKRIKFTPHERQYVGANFRFITTKLGLFHYLPEIQGNENTAVLHLIEVVVERMIANGEVRSRGEAIQRLVNIIEERVQSGTSTLITVTEAADLRITLQSLRDNIVNFWEKAPERIPEFIEQFRDDLAETSQSSRLLYDIATLSRDLRSEKVKFLENVLSEIDSWEHRLHLDKEV